MAVDLGIKIKRKEITDIYDDFKLNKTLWSPWFRPKLKITLFLISWLRVKNFFVRFCKRNIFWQSFSKKYSVIRLKIHTTAKWAAA